LETLSWLVIVLLVIFTLRRYVLIVASLLPGRHASSEYEPPVVVIVAARNEEGHLPGLLEALERLEYPAEKLHFLLVNDGSSDATGNILDNWVAGRPNARYLELVEGVGKAEALNRALRESPEAELVAVYDADLRPHPDSLKAMAAAFGEPRVGAVSGYRRPSNADRSPVAAYAALEACVHQLVTQAGKERFGWNPTTMGGHCVYRRSALLEVGGFPPGSLSEDIEVSLALVAVGRRTRFLREAVAGSLIVESLRRYWNQRSRWTQGMYASARRASRLESWLVAAGYADRLAFVGSLALFGLGHMGFVWPVLYLTAPAAAILVALGRADPSKRFVLYLLLWSLPMFTVDVGISLFATISGPLRRRVPWHTGDTPSPQRHFRG
jgi:cellulose synthase/poly-beta-1,6-N-acetylglucosamine synthase-like glycosyltransferase